MESPLWDLLFKALYHTILKSYLVIILFDNWIVWYDTILFKIIRYNIVSYHMLILWRIEYYNIYQQTTKQYCIVLCIKIVSGYTIILYHMIWCNMQYCFKIWYVMIWYVIINCFGIMWYDIVSYHMIWYWILW